MCLSDRNLMHIRWREYERGSNLTAEVIILKPHLTINIRNVNESVSFYRKMFGIEPAKVRTG